MAEVQIGLERVLHEPEWHKRLAGRRLGLLSHGAAVDSSYRTALQLLQARFDLRVLFGPEHGFFGTAQDMVAVQGESVDTDLRVISLYGESELNLSPQKADLQTIDVLVVDLQDVGSRYYTYVWSAALALRVAARAGIEVLVLDRPNPLGGQVVEGMPQRPGFRSFVGLHDVAVRHGMTIGELLRRVQRIEGLPKECLTVLPMQGWRRSMFFDETGLPWVMPSPNMPTLSTAIVYPGACLIEGTRLSEGRGTTRPFEIWGDPDFPVAEVSRVEVPGAILRPLAFQPTFQKHATRLCRGIQVHVTDRNAFRSYHAYLRWIAAALREREFAECFRTEVYEYESSRRAIDLLTGGPEFRELIRRGEPLDTYLQEDSDGALSFAAEREQDLLYFG